MSFTYYIKTKTSLTDKDGDPLYTEPTTISRKELKGVFKSCLHRMKVTKETRPTVMAKSFEAIEKGGKLTLDNHVITAKRNAIAIPKP